MRPVGVTMLKKLEWKTIILLRTVVVARFFCSFKAGSCFLTVLFNKSFQDNQTC